MKKIVTFCVVLFCSRIAMADGGIPLLVFMGSNFFVTGNFLFPFFWGLLLFWFVCSIEKRYLAKKLNIKEKIYKRVIIANIYSTLWGILFTIGLSFIQSFLCGLISSCKGECQIACVLMGPLVVLPIKSAIWSFVSLFLQFFIYLFLLGWLSWFVEYRYLKKRLNEQKLKKTVAFANLYSYIGMTVLSVLLSFSFRYIVGMTQRDCAATCQREADKEPHLTLQGYGKSGRIIGCHCDFCDDRVRDCDWLKK